MPEPMSKGEWLQMMDAFLTGFPTWRHDVKKLIAVDDRVIARLVDHTKHEGEFNGISPTGNRVEIGIIAMFRFRDGKIIEHREEADMLLFNQQLGM